MSPAAPLDAVRAALAGSEAWLVGGTVRDRLLGRGPEADLDLALAGDPRAAARRVARATGGASFALSDAHGAWRVTGEGWQVDLVALQGATLAEDLAARDLTINAMAEPLAGGDLVDPHGGAADLAARRLRMVAADAFDRDALRALRVARLATTLGFAVEPATAEAARARAAAVAGVAAERVFAELRALVGADAAVGGLRLLDDLALTPVVLPELAALHGVEQSVYHHLDVHGHTLAVLQAAIDLERDPGAVLAPADHDREERVRALLREPLADGLDRAGGLRWAALLHDAAKPRTRVDLGGGRVGFPGHDRVGADLARAALTRLRASERLRAHVAALTRHHLRLGFLVHDVPLDRRAVHRYLVATAPVSADVTLLTVADRVATRGRNAGPAIAGHLALAAELLDAALEQRAGGGAAPLVRGDELAAALGLRPGPQLGALLAEIEEARYAGEVTTPDEAVALARRALAAAAGGDRLPPR